MPFVMDIFENICRTCGNDCLQQFDIFVDSVLVQEKNVPITELLSTCLPASGSLPPLSQDDDYPKQICRVCVQKLSIMYEFNKKWLTANNEFNVALKFEQRRNRSRRAEPKDQVLPPEPSAIKTVFKQEPNDAGNDAELSPRINSTANYPCASCDESYHTLAAYQKHHKVSHRNKQYICYTPGH